MSMSVSNEGGAKVSQAGNIPLDNLVAPASKLANVNRNQDFGAITDPPPAVLETIVGRGGKLIAAIGDGTVRSKQFYIGQFSGGYMAVNGKGELFGHQCYTSLTELTADLVLKGLIKDGAKPFRVPTTTV